MAAYRLLGKLLIYYAVLAAVVAVATSFLGWQDYLPIGRVQALIGETGTAPLVPGVAASVPAAVKLAHMTSLGPSIVWLIAGVAGALLAALPVSWVYMEVRNPGDYDQSLIDTIVVLPLVVTSIVIVVQHSLALSFSLAGIAGAARYRNTLKSSGDLLFILLSIGIGLSTGIGALELALVTSAAFNLCFIILWTTGYGERADMKRYLADAHGNGHGHHHDGGGTVTATTTAAIVTEVTETFDKPAKPEKPDKDDD